MRQTIVLRGEAQRNRAIDLVRSLQVDEKKPLAVIVEPYEPEHTRAQQKMYRACLGEAAKEIGYAPDELHELLLGKYFGTRTITLGDTIVIRPERRTTKNERGEREPLGRKKMSDFFEWAMQFLAAEFGISA